MRGINREVAEIVETVLEYMSLGQAATHLEHRVGREGIRSLQSGKVGWERTMRDFALGFADRFRTHYGAAIQAERQSTDDDAVADWFASKGGFEPAAPDKLEAIAQRAAELAVEGLWARLVAAGVVAGVVD